MQGLGASFVQSTRYKFLLGTAATAKLGPNWCPSRLYDYHEESAKRLIGSLNGMQEKPIYREYHMVGKFVMIFCVFSAFRDAISMGHPTLRSFNASFKS
jgi:hypothetical protein